jgi:hypothetical protein
VNFASITPGMYVLIEIEDVARCCIIGEGPGLVASPFFIFQIKVEFSESVFQHLRNLDINQFHEWDMFKIIIGVR